MLDEPSSGLDPVVRRDILAAIIRTIADEGRTVLFSSHLLDEVERVADQVAIIHQGRIAAHRVDGRNQGDASPRDAAIWRAGRSAAGAGWFTVVVRAEAPNGLTSATARASSFAGPPRRLARPLSTMRR